MTLSLNPWKWLGSLKQMPTGAEMVIVAGMPKSGTTAIAKLLGAATGQTVCSDPFYTLTQMNVDFRKELFEGHLLLATLWRRYRRVFSGSIVKDPNFILLLDQLREMLPNAKIVFIMRDPRDNIRSILNRLDLPGNPRGVDLNLVNLPIGWHYLLTGQYPPVAGDNYVEVLARRWVMAAEALIKHRDYCFEIRYEDFKESKSAEIIKLAGRLGYNELSNIEHLTDIQYQPRGNVSISWEDFFGGEQLEVIDCLTGPVFGKFGYEIHKASS